MISGMKWRGANSNSNSVDVIGHNLHGYNLKVMSFGQRLEHRFLSGLDSSFDHLVAVLHNEYDMVPAMIYVATSFPYRQWLTPHTYI